MAPGAAAEGQRALTAADWPPGVDLRVRMGLHLGEATHRDGAYVGLEVHRAARIAAAGHGGQVLVSQAMAAVLGDRLPEGLALRELGVDATALDSAWADGRRLTTDEAVALALAA